MSQKFWDRIGYASIGIIAGFLYALVVFAVLLPFHPDIALVSIIKVFCFIFGVSGLILGGAITNIALASVNCLYFLYGYLATFSSLLPLLDYRPTLKFHYILIVLGLISGGLLLVFM